MRIVERHFANKSGNDETYFLRLYGRARRFHRHGKALDTVAELAGCISEAFWEFHKTPRISPGVGNFGARFYKDACKVRCLINDHGATIGGYIVLHGELKALWCNEPGEGWRLLNEAITVDGATELNCFDGPLVGLYSQYGFKVVRREPNRAHGEPDLVWMELHRD